MSILYRLQSVRFGYNSTNVLDIGDFCIPDDSMTAIIGPNGSGKTTLLNLLAFLILPSAGRLSYREKPVNSANWRQFRTCVGYVQQKPYLLNMSVQKNIELGLKFRRLSAIERHERSSTIMADLDIVHLARRRATELSGGEIQKVAIARALVLDPDVLVLDEPFTHLDTGTAGFFEKLITRLRTVEKKTVVFTSHDHFMAQALSDRVYSMLNGHLVADPMTNLYSGRVCQNEHLFDTGQLQIHIPEHVTDGSHIVVDPEHLVVSKQALQSSMRNRFQGRVVALQEQRTAIRVTVEAGERFQVVITHEAMQDLRLQPGDPVWISFKSSAVRVFAAPRPG